jgi:hypothetical protein
MLWVADQVPVRYKAWTVFTRSNAGIVGSNPTRGMDVCVRLSCLCCLGVGSGLATSWSPVQGVLPTVYMIKKMKERPRSNKGQIDRYMLWVHFRTSICSSLINRPWPPECNRSYERNKRKVYAEVHRIEIGLVSVIQCSALLQYDI